MSESAPERRLPHRAILLLGPTGAGKTPLGEQLARRGFRRQPCVHFDFGDQLRQLVAAGRPEGCIRAAELAFLGDVLCRGALLEDEHFPLAEQILRTFLARQQVAPETRVVLNGLPRHVGQAEALAPLLPIDTVVILECDAATVGQRLASNVGGDRAERADDDRASVQKKLEWYQARTAPLVAFCQARGAELVRVAVTPKLTAAAMWEALHLPRGEQAAATEPVPED